MQQRTGDPGAAMNDIAVLLTAGLLATRVRFPLGAALCVAAIAYTVMS